MPNYNFKSRDSEIIQTDQKEEETQGGMNTLNIYTNSTAEKVINDLTRE